MIDKYKDYHYTVSGQTVALGAAANHTFYFDPPQMMQSFLFTPSIGFTGTVDYGIYNTRNTSGIKLYTDTNAATADGTRFFAISGGQYLIPRNSKHYIYVSGAYTGTFYIDVVARGG